MFHTKAMKKQVQLKPQRTCRFVLFTQIINTMCLYEILILSHCIVIDDLFHCKEMACIKVQPYLTPETFPGIATDQAPHLKRCSVELLGIVKATVEHPAGRCSFS